jgi:hypothetical protein
MAAPWQLNRAIHRVTGRTWEELYEDFRRDTARYTRAARRIAWGLEEGAALTAQGEYVRAPRFLPDGTLVYESADGQSMAQLRAIDAGVSRAPTPGTSRPRALDWLAGPRASRGGRRRAAGLRHGRPPRPLFLSRPLPLEPRARRRRRALGRRRDERLTEGWRAQQPDVTPTATTWSSRSTTAAPPRSWRCPSPTDAARALRPRRFEQVYAPRYSPDGRTVAFSHWRAAAPRPRDVSTAPPARSAPHRRPRPRPLAHVQPDGRYLLWSSDRTGVPTSRDGGRHRGLRPRAAGDQHVLGAFQPASARRPHPRLRHLLHRGYDLFRLPFDPARWRDPEVVPRATPSAATPDDPRAEDAAPSTFPTSDSPVQPVAHAPPPRILTAELTTDGFGPQLALRVTGADVVNRHAWNAPRRRRPRARRPQRRPHLRLPRAAPDAAPAALRTVDAGGGYPHRAAQPHLGGRAHRGRERGVAGLPRALRRAHRVADLRRPVGAGLRRPPRARPLPRPQRARRRCSPSRAGSRGSAPPGGTPARSATPTPSATRRASTSSPPCACPTPSSGAPSASVEFSAACRPTSRCPGARPAAPHPRAAPRRGHRHQRPRRARDLLPRRLPRLQPRSLARRAPRRRRRGGIALRGYKPDARGGEPVSDRQRSSTASPCWQAQRGLSTLPLFVQRLWGRLRRRGHAAFGRFNADNLAVGAGAECSSTSWWASWCRSRCASATRTAS